MSCIKANSRDIGRSGKMILEDLGRSCFRSRSAQGSLAKRRTDWKRLHDARRLDLELSRFRV